ncbi:MAG TPA: carboxypeptidase regulatory-like domain-containing protein [Pseudonocardiaceae bacterium]|nr:carboxypeptidase regulatory-like domain-containing protein [Pseudonocardiaceae bacterium]
MFLTATGTAAASPPAAAPVAATAAAAAKPPAKTPSPTTGSHAAAFTHACGTSAADRFSCFALKRTDITKAKTLAADTTPAGYGPSDIQAAYRLPAAGGSPTVAIVDAFDDPNAESDLAVYRAQYGLPACTTANGCFTKVGQDGSTKLPDPPPANDDWVSEITLDLDAVSSACPGCHILLVEADTDLTGPSLPTAVQTAYTMGAKFISMSWGGAEDGTENAQDAQYFAHPGVVYTASSGDNGYDAGVIYPSTSQYVVSVGGTSLDRASGTSRGWSESVWDGAGSGCSADVTKPAWQAGISACPTRAATDISADADPSTGLAIYNSYSDGGWDVYGGTSLASPLIASMYALAGTPVPGTYPSRYPYEDLNAASDINDVTSGATGSCTPSVLCTGGTGWDGPSGLGTPNGVDALTTGPHGDIAGHVTDAATKQPISGASVSTQDGRTVTSGADGGYDIKVPAGSYDLTATKYGYDAKTVSGVSVSANATVAEDFALSAEAFHTISGAVADGSGHGWPMRAKITIDGYPNGPIYSNPYTGKYSVSLPDNASYTLHVTPMDLSGYTKQNVTVALSGSDVRRDIAMPVDAGTCTAPGYAYHDTGTTETFTGWQGATPQDGWTVTDAIGNSQTWRFDNPGGWAGPPGGDADFADIDSNAYGQGGSQDSSLVSPVVDLSGNASPEIGIDSTYISFPGQTGSVDLSLDGGTTWSTVWNPYGVNPGHFDIPIPQAAGQSQVRVRFHFTGSWSRRWEIDDVLIGGRSCAPLPGGLVAGVVTDANTGTPLDGATVTSDVDATASGTTGATPDDPGLGDGYYWLFSSHTGPTAFTVSDGKYAARHATINVVADSVSHTDFALAAGHLTIATPTVSVSEVLGATKSQILKFGNDGTAPVHVDLGETDAGFTPLGSAVQAPASAAGAPTTVVKTTTSKDSTAGGANSASPAPTGPTLRAASAAVGPWTDVADYPTAVMDPAVASHGGKVYTVGGYDGTYKLQDANVYTPATNAWSAIAALPEPVQAASAGFVDDTLYVVGGWNNYGPSTHAYAYDLADNTWSRVADLPSAVAAAGVAVVDGKLYVIGGCTGTCGAATAAVYSYDPGNGLWTQEPAYPTAVAYAACGGVTAKVICAGGVSGSTTKSTYAYTPGASGWTQEADLPVDDWGAAAASANGRLEVIGGAIDNGAAVTNQGFGYDPSTNSWSALPNANNATYRGGAACGAYKVGGALGGFQPVPFTEYLPGYDQCGGDVPWMSEDKTSFDVAPGQTVSVRITTDSSVLSQPGTYQGELVAQTDSPYGTAAPVGVVLRVTPPAKWGKITGTVSDSSGAPIAGATVAICTMYDTRTGACGPTTYTLKTDGRGGYQLWLNQGFNPLQVIAAKDGYTPVMKIAKIHQGETTTTDFTLSASSDFTAAKVQEYLNAQMRSK